VKPDQVVLWLPRADEHELAASLGMCERDPALLRELLEAARGDIERRHPGVRVRIARWHVWRVVRAMHRAGVINTPDGRALVFGLMASGG
jgi:hypothetical protein